jgi:hypothetical protein
MAAGWVALHGVFPMTAWDVGLTWEPAEIRTMKRRWRDVGRRGWVTLLSGRLFRRRERAAALCPRCGAVVIDPENSPVEGQQDHAPGSPTTEE